MAERRNTYEELLFYRPGLYGWRRYVRAQEGWDGNKKDPYSYDGYKSRTLSTGKWKGTYDWYYAIDAGNTNGMSSWRQKAGIPPECTPIFNRAYNRFVEDINGEQSSLGVFAAEWKESLGMINSRAQSLYQSFRDLRRGRLEDALGHLGVKPLRRHRKLTKRETANQASGLWLEYWFGWSPMVQDMYNAGDVIQQPLPYGTGRGSASGVYQLHRKDNYDEHRTSARVKYKFQADFLLDNPNLYLMNRLGLANPATVAWELIPFSFVVDWCTGFGTYVNSMSDFVGLEMTRAMNSRFIDGVDSYEIFAPSDPWGYSGKSKCRYVALIRRLGIDGPIPNLQISANLGESLTRTATAVSLLTQILQSSR